MKSVPPKVPREAAEFVEVDVLLPVPVAEGVPVPVVGKFVGVLVCVPLINMVHS
jgi:hypothetical protein